MCHTSCSNEIPTAAAKINIVSPNNAKNYPLLLQQNIYKNREPIGSLIFTHLNSFKFLNLSSNFTTIYPLLPTDITGMSFSL